MSLGARVRKAFRASLFGWIVALIASMPFQIFEAVGNAGAGGVGLSLTLWCLLTFVIAVYWCGFFLLPLAWLIPATWIMRHRKLWITASPLFGVLMMAIRLHVWTAADHDGISLINFWMWAGFAAAFFVTTAALYERFVRPASSESPA